ncbi:hypothetical protein DICPUDRAFT_32622 [Dictyostelium purpureum]|uniref:Cytochrome c oxidase assembly protein COX16 homolog, mitochondrial n=1 Tax=Dictyostelium purpureum TaxID=5786 RepID=F0ZJH3_DICPU|nr:uncharacterized protein DICPUDRAFT_32622 [Dictyostelium purpureum]EGC35921.1 hypothetical protein DICPUDRAFT_32622 [Dictyostelium purpureum]|eukprot:XP_003287575.1 hypothetical protein DICPUDRAFT_32622 [Dictyostelium purpureum]
MGKKKTSLLGTLIPMIGITLVSLGVLNHFMEHKFQRWDNEMLGNPNKKPTSLEEEYEKMSKKIDFSNWENKTVPGSQGYESDEDKK